MNVADAIAQGDSSARRLRIFRCNCNSGPKRSLATTYAFSDGHRYLWLSAQRWRQSADEAFVNQPAHAMLIDDPAEAWTTVAKCRGCRSDWLFTTFPRAALPDQPGFLVSRFDRGPEPKAFAVGQRVDTYRFDPATLTDGGRGLLLAKLGPATFGAVAP